MPVEPEIEMVKNETKFENETRQSAPTIKIENISKVIQKNFTIIFKFVYNIKGIQNSIYKKNSCEQYVVKLL